MHSVRVSKQKLYGIAIITLLIPNILFLMTWIRMPIMVLSTSALIASFIMFTHNIKKQEISRESVSENEWETSVIVILACLACAALWTFFSGIGGFFYQNDDFYGRNAIFHDMLEHEWPVRFEGTSFALTYYIGYWIVPALLGKLCALFCGQEVLWIAANYFLYIQTVWFLFLVFLLYLSLLNIQTVIPACFFLFLFVMFSGMDGLACFFLNDWTDQIEWWAQTWQFSSHTTCLFWVFNQALPAWLATLVIISMQSHVEVFAFLGLSVLPYSPLPLVGIVIICVGLFINTLKQIYLKTHNVYEIKRCVIQAFSPCNLLAVLGSLPCLFYLSSNAATGNAPFRFEMYLYAYSLPTAVLRFVAFCLVEWALYAIILAPSWHKESLFRITVISLIFAPMFRVGYHMDFSMRASIPGLLILSIYCAKHLKHAIPNGKWLSSVALVFLLVIGGITPMLEFERGAYRVMKAGTNRLFSDPYKTVLHPYADTGNFICSDTSASLFYKYIAKP